jgi:proteasome lid subunit RPN8/RPN11
MVALRNSKIEIGQAKDVAKVFQDLLNLEDSIDRDKEHFYVMHLDSHRRINLVELVAIGTLADANIHPRETYRRAVMEGSHSIIVAHNHPSGDVSPSDNDITVTVKLDKAGEIYIFPFLIISCLPRPISTAFWITKCNLPHRLMWEKYRMKKRMRKKDPLCQYQMAEWINAP